MATRDHGVQGLGYTPAVDTEALPLSAQEIPWWAAISLTMSYALGANGWHWSYVLGVFWLWYWREMRRRRRMWATLQKEALEAVAVSKDAESVAWINNMLRAVWPHFEPGVSSYTKGKVQAMLDANTPKRLGVYKVTLKDFSFGAVETRRSDNKHRLAPVLMHNVRMLAKSVEPSLTSDPKEQRIRYVFSTDVRWHSGSTPVLHLEFHLLHKFLSVSLDAEVSDLIFAGNLRGQA